MIDVLFSIVAAGLALGITGCFLGNVEIAKIWPAITIYWFVVFAKYVYETAKKINNIFDKDRL